MPMRLKTPIICPVCAKELANLRDGTVEILYAAKAKGVKGEVRAVHTHCAGKSALSESFPLARLEDDPIRVGLHLLSLMDEFYLSQLVADQFFGTIYEDYRPSRFWDEVHGRKKDDRERW